MGFAIKDNVKYIGIDIIANLMINSLNVWLNASRLFFNPESVGNMTTFTALPMPVLGIIANWELLEYIPKSYAL